MSRPIATSADEALAYLLGAPVEHRLDTVDGEIVVPRSVDPPWRTLDAPSIDSGSIAEIVHARADSQSQAFLPTSDGGRVSIVSLGTVKVELTPHIVIVWPESVPRLPGAKLSYLELLELRLGIKWLARLDRGRKEADEDEQLKDIQRQIKGLRTRLAKYFADRKALIEAENDLTFAVDSPPARALLLHRHLESPPRNESDAQLVVLPPTNWGDARPHVVDWSYPSSGTKHVKSSRRFAAACARLGLRPVEMAMVAALEPRPSVFGTGHRYFSSDPNTRDAATKYWSRAASRALRDFG